MLRRLARLAAACLLTGCSPVAFDLPQAAGDPRYAAVFPWFAEFCAVSQISKKPGFGADIRGEVGGHAVFYLNGACRLRDAGYPVLVLCDTAGAEAADGVGLSMNAHFSNAKWVATPGRDFFFQGGLDPQGGLTRAGYQAVQREARRLGIYRGVTFHDEVFAMMAPGTDPEFTRYEVSVATDYAIALGRGRHCAKVPVTRAQMARMVDFLNEGNAPYRSGARVFRWSVFRDNCIHLAHDALAVAGLWPAWPTHDTVLTAMFDFPVPRNEFVDIMRRANDTALLDPARLLADPAGRARLRRDGVLPVGPGALAESRPPLMPNEVYETSLKLVFYDEPMLGRYQAWSDAIFADPRLTDLAANLRWHAGLQVAASAPVPAEFAAAQADALARQQAAARAALRRLGAAP